MNENCTYFLVRSAKKYIFGVPENLVNSVCVCPEVGKVESCCSRPSLLTLWLCRGWDQVYGGETGLGKGSFSGCTLVVPWHPPRHAHFSPHLPGQQRAEQWAQRAQSPSNRLTTFLAYLLVTFPVSQIGWWACYSSPRSLGT